MGTAQLLNQKSESLRAQVGKIEDMLKHYQGEEIRVHINTDISQKGIVQVEELVWGLSHATNPGRIYHKNFSGVYTLLTVVQQKVLLRVTTPKQGKSYLAQLVDSVKDKAALDAIISQFDAAEAECNRILEEGK